MVLTDEQLRRELGKYMDIVPPVTGSTRDVLQSKLAKFQAGESKDRPPKTSTITNEKPQESLSSGRKHITVTTVTTTSSSQQIPSPSPVSGGPVEIVSKRANISPKNPSSPSKATVNNISTGGDSPSSSFVYEDSQYRVRRFPATELPDYPGGIPIFRRRSLHPDGGKQRDRNNGVPDPYEEFVIRSPRLQAQADATRIISRVMSGRGDYHYSDELRSKRVPYLHAQSPYASSAKSRLPCFKDILGFLEYAFFGLLALLRLPFKAVAIGGRRVSAALNFKLIIIIAIICALIAAAIFFILSDPFYRNPVSEFAERMAEPLASILHKE